LTNKDWRPYPDLDIHNLRSNQFDRYTAHGKLSDKFDRRSIYELDIALFALGSLIVALSPTILFAMVGRARQGFGAGRTFPVASALSVILPA
jgi:hypothetical protein